MRMHQRIDIFCLEQTSMSRRSAKPIIAFLDASICVVSPQLCMKPSVAKCHGSALQIDGCICADVTARVHCLIGTERRRKTAPRKPSCFTSGSQPRADARGAGTSMIHNPHHDRIGMLLQHWQQLCQDTISVNRLWSAVRFCGRRRVVTCWRCFGAAGAGGMLRSTAVDIA